eukprot:NODE_1108_length_1067_cov_226.621807_g767_i0.p1 GENE.NODE_1108_length_1067_cov_226.621807_g767_i0~~NODE_1108_length_1067_cov_226.621807_g767_i0.p1  ORF type:complete len:258 (+),score=42.97 NODE_1108_length_1067_cov_226.621807_g767_i0:157-930(+)
MPATATPVRVIPEVPILTRPSNWGPEVATLKMKVRELEDAEQQLLDSFESGEVLAAKEMAQLEERYTAEMEEIREGDLLRKEKLHRKHIRAQRKLPRLTPQEKARRRLEHDLQVEDEVAELEAEMRHRLERSEDELVMRHRKAEAALEERIRQLRDGGPSGGDTFSDAIGIELVNASTPNGGTRVVHVSGLAADAGLKTGDVITNVTRALDIHSRGDLTSLMKTAKPQEQMMLTMSRDGREVQVVLTVGKRNTSTAS